MAITTDTKTHRKALSKAFDAAFLCVSVMTAIGDRICENLYLVCVIREIRGLLHRFSLIFDRAGVAIMISLMKNTLSVVALFTVALLMGTALTATVAGQAGQATRPGRLIVWG